MTYLPVVDDTSADVAILRFLLGYGERTREAYRIDLVCYSLFCDNLETPVLSAGRTVCDAYARYLSEVRDYTPSTQARRLASVSSFYAWAVAEGLCEANPMSSVRRPKVSDESMSVGLTKSELQALLRAAKLDSDRLFGLVTLLALNGLRISEALGLKMGDWGVERGQNVLKVRRKGGKYALIPISGATLDALTPLLTEHADEYVFRTASGRPWSRQKAWMEVKRAARTAGLDMSARISPHSLRHTFVTLSLEAGVPLHDVQDAAGHQSPVTTQRYNRARDRLTNAPTHRLTAWLDESA